MDVATGEETGDGASGSASGLGRHDVTMCSRRGRGRSLAWGDGLCPWPARRAPDAVPGLEGSEDEMAAAWRKKKRGGALGGRRRWWRLGYLWARTARVPGQGPGVRAVDVMGARRGMHPMLGAGGHPSALAAVDGKQRSVSVRRGRRKRPGVGKANSVRGSFALSVREFGPCGWLVGLLAATSAVLA